MFSLFHIYTLTIKYPKSCHKKKFEEHLKKNISKINFFERYGLCPYILITQTTRLILFSDNLCVFCLSAL